MSTGLRIILIAVSVLTTAYLIKKIRKAQMNIEDSIFWIVMPAILILISVFPNIAESASQLIGIHTPVNFVFLAIIFILIIKLFSLSIKLSQVENKLNTLIQEYAIRTSLVKEKKERGADGTAQDRKKSEFEELEQTKRRA